MDRLPTPTITPLARRWLQGRDSRLSDAQHALLRTIDGLRNVIELESIARNLGLARDELEILRRAGLLTYDTADAVIRVR